MEDTLIRTSTLVELHVIPACEAWLQLQEPNLAPRTVFDYRGYIKTLDRTFRKIYADNSMPDYGKLTIVAVDGDLMRAYQSRRRKEGCGPGLINKECGIIIGFRNWLAEPGRDLAKRLLDYRRLKMPKDYEGPGRALRPSENEVWERVCISAAKHAVWGVAACCSIVSKGSGLGPGEMLSLQLKDVSLGDDSSTVTIEKRGAKRVRRERTVVLMDRAHWAIGLLLKRAREVCGCTSPTHYLVPFRERNGAKYNPEKPARGYRVGFDHLLALAETEFRQYDLRHHAVSVALSNPKVSLAAAELHFGHISQKMKSRYYHGNLENSRVIAAALSAKKEVERAAAPQSAKKKAASVSRQELQGMLATFGKLVEAIQ